MIKQLRGEATAALSRASIHSFFFRQSGTHHRVREEAGELCNAWNCAVRVGWVTLKEAAAAQTKGEGYWSILISVSREALDRAVPSLPRIIAFRLSPERGPLIVRPKYIWGRDRWTVKLYGNLGPPPVVDGRAISTRHTSMLQRGPPARRQACVRHSTQANKRTKSTNTNTGARAAERKIVNKRANASCSGRIWQVGEVGELFEDDERSCPLYAVVFTNQ